MEAMTLRPTCSWIGPHENATFWIHEGLMAVLGNFTFCCDMTWWYGAPRAGTAPQDETTLIIGSGLCVTHARPEDF